jgi:Protein of unknown function (DUF3078)
MIMKKIAILLFAACLSLTAIAQRSDAEANAKEMESTDVTKLPNGWKKSIDVLFGAVWTNTDNWVGATDKYNISGTLNAIAKADRKQGNALWLNELRWVYGANMAPSTFDKARKAQDQLMLSSMYAPQIKPKWFYGVKFNLNTQLMPSYIYDNNGNQIYQSSGFMAPGIIRLGVGILYRPNPNFKVYFSPLTANITTKFGSIFKPRSGEPGFGVDAGKTFRIGLGAMLSAEYGTTLFNKVGYKTRLDVFTDYVREPFVKNDIDWLNSFNFNLTKQIAVGAVFNVRHYPFIAPATQYMHTVGISGAFKLK